jgi:uncharacterized membrane protein
VPVLSFRKLCQSALGRIWLAVTLFAAFGLAISSPALAHKGEKHGQTQQVQQQLPPGQMPTGTMPHGTMAEHGQMNGMEGMDMEMDRSSMPLFERLYSWFGRLHPMIVHFPIAFFPAALFTAVVGRRRPSFSAPVQFLVVTGGIFAPIAAVAGWLNGMSVDPDPVLTYHRWLGVVIGIAGAGLGVWAWRRPWEDRGAGMILALTVMTVAIAVQGFLGAGVTHGIDHLMF